MSGYAEMIKHALISSVDNYASVLLFDLDAKIDYAFLNEMVARSVEVKEEIVEKDPQEHNIRKALNFGHTIGHGVEAPKVGRSVSIRLLERELTLYRMPSSSRAYPKPLTEKAEAYKKMFMELGML